MRDATRKLLGTIAIVGGLGLVIFGSRYYGGTRYSIADTLGLSADVQLLGLVVSAIMFFGCGIAVGASLPDESPDSAD